MHRRLLTAAVLVAVAVLPAAAQDPPPRPPRPPAPIDTSRWDIEFHRGFGLGQPARGGSGSVPPAGDAFTTNGGSPSRRVTSWYFGDGAALLNGVLGSFGRSERITPLDGMLTRGSTDFTPGDSFGGRVTRALRPGMALEIGFDLAPATYTVTNEARDAIQETSNSFPVVFAGLVATGQGVAFTNPVLTSSFAINDGSGREMQVTGALVFTTKRASRFRPYAVVGGGLARATGEAVATLTGRYSFSLPSGGRVDETDQVTMRFAGGNGIVVLAGAGLSMRLTRGSGVRVDGRVTLVQNHVHTRVDTGPVVVSSLPADAIWSSLTPGIQFSTHPSTNLESNLAAAALSGFRTLKGSGFNNRFNFSVGYFVRF